ncbi:TetR/AcrR family transcriptional regulator [Photobacterium indicum]
MDKITAATGLSKATIYKYFQSKENLIAQALDAYRKSAIEHLTKVMNDDSLSLEEKLSERFETLRQSLAINAFNGCYFQLAHSEFCNAEENITDICTIYKQQRVSMVCNLLETHNVENAQEKAVRAELIFNGLIATLQISKDPTLIDIARDMYMDVINS